MPVKPEASGSSSLKPRLITGVCLAFVAVFAMSSRAFWFPLAFCQIVLALCVFELGEILPDTKLWPNIILTVLIFGALMVAPAPSLPWIAVGLCSSSVILLWFGLQGGPSLCNSLGGPTLIATSLAAVLFLQSNTAVGGSLFGLNLAFVAVPALWVGDTFAYVIGKRLGRHPLAPTISPKKTIEGSVGHLLGSISCAVAFGLASGVPLAVCLGCGFIASIMGQSGDLFQSMLKRRAEKKDSGQLLPGHGGILDRVDAMLLAMPALLLFLWLTVPTMFHVKQ